MNSITGIASRPTGSASPSHPLFRALPAPYRDEIRATFSVNTRHANTPIGIVARTRGSLRCAAHDHAATGLHTEAAHFQAMIALLIKHNDLAVSYAADLLARP